MLFGSTMLEVAIGVIFVYLLVSLLCSALSELIESFLRYRYRDLERGISKLLDDPNLAKALLKHPLINALGERPSYIPSRTFSLALWNLATTEEGRQRVAKVAAEAAGKQQTPEGEAAAEKRTVADDIKDAVATVQAGAGAARKGAAAVTQDVEAIRGVISSLPENYSNIKVSLLTLIDEADGDLKKARANVEKWYDDSMDRVSGWYKRRTHKILMVIGLLAAAGLNIDTVNITKALLYNDTLRASVVEAAEKHVNENPAPTPVPTATPAPTATPVPTATPTQTPTHAATPTPRASATATPGAAATPTPETPAARVKRLRGELEDLGLPIGWISEPVKPAREDETFNKGGKFDEKRFVAAEARYAKELESYPSDPRRLPDSPYGWLLKIIGIFITALAVSQGAPFWFDLLNKFIVIRSTVKPQEKSQTQPSKDKPAPETEEEKKKKPDGK